MDINELYAGIESLDSRILDLFQQRMDLSEQVAAYRNANRLPLRDTPRERELMVQIARSARPEYVSYAQTLFSTMSELSTCHKSASIGGNSELRAAIASAVENTPRMFPATATVACQGVEGAYSQHAAVRLFKNPAIMYFKSFGNVFSAIESGLCKYGVLPIENSSAGSVKKVYDLMLKHDFKIVRSLRLKVDHNLLAPAGVKLEDIREIISHEQAIMQCSGFLEKLGPGVKITRVENTAMAANAVATTTRRDLAAISSYACARLYGLNRLASDIQDRDNNYTRFICITKDIEIYPGANRTSIMMTLPHEPGSLYKALSRFYALGIDIVKLESRPIPERDFEFMFYFDLDTSVYSDEFGRMIDDLAAICEEFTYLGSYSEVI